MDILPEVADTMQTVLTDVADTAACETGFIQRQRKLTGATFVQTLVFGWLANSESTLEELTQTAATLGVSITPQALDQRFTEQASQCLEQVLEEAVCQVIAAEAVAVPILLRFNGVYVQDSTTITLPNELADVWKGCGQAKDDSCPSGLKVQVRWELASGAIEHLKITDGVTHDRESDKNSTPLPKGALRLADLGYFSLSQLKAFCRDGVLWLTRLQAMCVVFDTDGQRKDLAQWLSRQGLEQVELSVIIGVEAQLPCRLLAQRVSKEVADKRRRLIRKQARKRGKTPSKTRLRLADWTILITNVPQEKLTVEEAMVLARVRWQIELLFKLWKSHGTIDEWRSDKPWRILCEVYAKLLAMVVQHWVLLIGCWHFPNRSLVKAAKTVARHALHLASAFRYSGMQRLIEALSTIIRCLEAGCRINKRRGQPHTYQLLLALTS